MTAWDKVRINGVEVPLSSVTLSGGLLHVQLNVGTDEERKTVDDLFAALGIVAKPDPDEIA